MEKISEKIQPVSHLIYLISFICLLSHSVCLFRLSVSLFLSRHVAFRFFVIYVHAPHSYISVSFTSPPSRYPSLTRCLFILSNVLSLSACLRLSVCFPLGLTLYLTT